MDSAIDSLSMQWQGVHGHVAHWDVNFTTLADAPRCNGNDLQPARPDLLPA